LPLAGSGNVFIDLGFDEAEARVMALRVELMMRLRERLREKGYKQPVAGAAPLAHSNVGVER
jgi:predicted XRE-type DNA-binding protein